MDLCRDTPAPPQPPPPTPSPPPVPYLNTPPPPPAILFRKNNAEQPHLRQLGHDLHRKMRRFVPLHHVRSDFALGEFPHTAAKVLLFLGEAEFHSLLGSLWVVAMPRQSFACLILHERPHQPTA